MRSSVDKWKLEARGRREPYHAEIGGSVSVYASSIKGTVLSPEACLVLVFQPSGHFLMNTF